MPRRDQRIDTSSEPEPLTSNPFAALGGQLPEDLAEHMEPTKKSEPRSVPPFAVQRTRKGGFPVFFERRPGGKVVTVVRNVTGDAEALLKLLRKRCGAGGCLDGDAVEIQGDHRERIEAILSE